MKNDDQHGAPKMTRSISPPRDPTWSVPMTLKMGPDRYTTNGAKRGTIYTFFEA